MAAARTVTVALLGNTKQLEDAFVRAGLVVEDTSKKIQGSAAAAGRAAREQAAAMGASATEQEAAAGRAAAAFTEAGAKISASQKAAGDAAARAARDTGAALDEQRAAYTRAVAAQREYEDAAKQSSTAAAAAAKASADEIVAANERVVAGQRALIGKTKESSASLAGFGGKVATAGLAAFAVAAYEGVKGAVSLQQAMETLHTQAGSTQAEVGKLTTGILNMAGAVGQSPQTLADGMYHVASSLNATLPPATRAATELQVLKIGAEGAGIGGANLTDVMNGLDAAIVSGISGAQNYSQAMGILNSTVGAGDMKMQDLAEALGTGLLGPLKVFGVSLKEAGGALAVFGDNNIRGADAGTKLAATVRIMAAASSTGAKALATIGISSLELGNDLRSGGLIKAVTDLKDHLDAAGVHGTAAAQLLTNAFGRKQSTGVLLLVDQLQRLVDKTNQVGAGAHTFAADWAAYTQTTAYKIAQLKDSVSALADKFGAYLIPKLLAVANAISEVVNWFARGSAAAQLLGGAIVGVLGVAVSAFAYTKAVAFIGAVKNMGYGVGVLATKIGSAATGIAANFGLVATTATTTEATVVTADEGIVASADTTAAGVDAAIGSTGLGLAIIGVGVGVTELATHWHSAMLVIERVTATMANGVIYLLNALIKGFDNTIGKLTFGLANIGQIAYATLPGAGGGGLSSIPGPGGLTLAQAKSLSSIPNFASKNYVPFGGPAPGSGIPIGTPTGIPGVTVPAIPKLPGVSGAALPTTSTTSSKSAAGSLPSPWSSGQSSVARSLMTYFQSQGLSKDAAAALIGNFMQESSLNPSMDSSGGIGLASWTASRASALKAFAGQLHQSWTSLAVQAQFVMHELRASYSGVLNAVRNSTNPSAAADIIGHQYEGAGVMGSRDSYAATVAASLTGSTSTSIPKAAKVTSGPGPNVLNMLKLAQELVGGPYNNQAGHSAAFNETVAQIKKFGTDCSGLVSVLLKEGISGIKSAQNTTGLVTQAGLAPGAGKYVTVYDRANAGANSHTLIEILGKYFESGGNSKYNPSGGIAQLTTAQAAGELAGGGFVAYHPTAAGLAGPVTGAATGAASAQGPAVGASLQTAINSFIAALDKAATAMTQAYNNLVQSGTLKTLERALGLNTGGIYRTFTRTIGGGGTGDLGSHVKHGSVFGTETIPIPDREAFKDELTKELVKVHGYALAQLDHDLGVRHGTALKTLVDKLVGLHGAALARIEEKLGRVRGDSGIAGLVSGHGDLSGSHHGGSHLAGHASGHADFRAGSGPLRGIVGDLRSGAPHKAPETYAEALRATIEAINPKAVIRAMNGGGGAPIEGMTGPANPAFRAELIKQLASVHGKALEVLDHDLGLKHGAAMDKLVAKLESIHGKALDKLEKKLTDAHITSRRQFDPLALNPLHKLGHELGHEPAKNLPSIMSIVEKASANSSQGKAFAAEVKELIATGQKSQAAALVAAHTAAMHALAQELYAEQVTKDGELLAMQATRLKDEGTAAQNSATSILNINKAVQQSITNAMAAIVTRIQDMTQIVSDHFAAMVTAVQDATTAMAEASNAVVTGIQDATTIKVDILGERGLYGLNLIAQKEQVALDVMKAGFDKQIIAAQQNLDAVTTAVHQREAQAQRDLDQKTMAQHALVALAQAHDDQVHISAAVKIAGAQARVDSLTLHEDTSVLGPAQMAVDLGATLPKAQQDVLGGILKKAQGQADKAEQTATNNLTSVTDTQNKLVQGADNHLSNITDTANKIIAQAGQTVADVTGQGNDAIAIAGQLLQGVQDTAAQDEATAQSFIDITKEESATQFAGSGLTVNITGLPLTDSAAIASEFGWILRTQIPAGT